MSMLEKMARQLATDALERVKPDTYTNVVDEIWLYRTADGKFRVSDHPCNDDDDAQGISYDTARETMVAMMAEQAGALVVVPEDAPGDPYLAQIAQLLVDSADVPTDAQDVADGAAIVGTVQRALDMLYDARGDVDGKSRDLNTMRRQCAANAEEIERYSAKISELNDKSDRIREQLYAAQQEIGALTELLSAAKRTAKRWEDEAANSQARYEGMEAALRIVLELAGVGK